MKGFEFHKLQASGNDFILLDAIGTARGARLSGRQARRKYGEFARKYCARQFSIGADGLLVIEPCRGADFRMRIFNPDGSEAEMCGNGARCVALWAAADKFCRGPARTVRFGTRAGVIESKVKNKKANYADVAIKMVAPTGLALDEALRVCGRKVGFSFINTGVPHTVVLVQGLDNIDVAGIGRAIRRHQRFSPAGTNVNFVEILKQDLIKVRTYERGVEDETLACGTGVTASAIISSYKAGAAEGRQKIDISTRSGELLRVYFNRRGRRITDIWLEGKAYLVYKGQVGNF